jgi:hypothetical protein
MINWKSNYGQMWVHPHGIRCSTYVEIWRTLEKIEIVPFWCFKDLKQPNIQVFDVPIDSLMMDYFPINQKMEETSFYEAGFGLGADVMSKSTEELQLAHWRFSIREDALLGHPEDCFVMREIERLKKIVGRNSPKFIIEPMWRLDTH